MQTADALRRARQYGHVAFGSHLKQAQFVFSIVAVHVSDVTPVGASCGATSVAAFGERPHHEGGGLCVAGWDAREMDFASDQHCRDDSSDGKQEPWRRQPPQISS